MAYQIHTFALLCSFPDSFEPCLRYSPVDIEYFNPSIAHSTLIRPRDTHMKRRRGSASFEAFPTFDISGEDGEKGEGCFWLLHPKRGGKEAAEFVRPVPVQRTLAKLGGRSLLTGRKQRSGYECTISMAEATLGVVE